MAKQLVLVANDDQEALGGFGHMLARGGFDMIVVQSAHDVLALIGTGPQIDLIVVSLRMRDMSGLELAAEVAERRVSVPIVIMAAAMSSACTSAAQLVGAAGVIDTAWPEPDILDAIGRYAQRLNHPAARGETRPGYAASRWMLIVTPVVRSDEDVSTLAGWSATVYKSVATIKRWCHMCGVDAGDSLDLARGLRIVTRHAGHRCRWFDLLAIAEPVTLNRFLHRAALVRDEPVPDIRTFLIQQQFVREPALLAALLAAIVS
jgi:CheY-like chemotaxis protein